MVVWRGPAGHLWIVSQHLKDLADDEITQTGPFEARISTAPPD